MDEIGKQIRQLILENRLKVSMSELARVTGVSSSQIRYWERKGFISSQQDQQNKNHYYTLLTVFQLLVIRQYLDQGYTLSVAVKKEQQRRALGHYFQQFLVDRVLNVQEVGPAIGEVELGTLSDDPSKEVYAVIKDGKTSLYLRPVRTKG